MIEVIWHHRNLDNLQRNQWEWLRGQRQLCALKREEIDYKMLSIKCNVHNGLTQKKQMRTFMKRLYVQESERETQGEGCT